MNGLSQDAGVRQAKAERVDGFMTHRIAIRSLSSVSEDTVEVERRSPLNWKFLEDDRPKLSLGK